MSEIITLRIYEVVGSSLCVSTQDGKKISNKSNNMEMKSLSCTQSIALIPSQAGLEIDCVGNVELLKRPMQAVFSSAKCPASLILKAHDYAKEIRDGETGIISGFHSPAEQEVLAVLLKGACPIIVVLGRRLEKALIRLVWRTEIEKGRMLILSPFEENQAYVTREMALTRNDLAARIAGRVLIVHASEGGSLQGQMEKWKSEGIQVEELNAE